MRRLWGGALALLGGSALLGWWLDVPALRNGLSRGLDLGPAAALAFLFSGVALAAFSSRRPGPVHLRIGLGAGLAVVVITTAVVVAPSYSWVERLLVSDALVGRVAMPKVSLTPGNAILLGLMGLLLAFRARGGTAWGLLAKTLGAFIAMLSAIAVLTYISARAALTGAGSVPTSINNALGFLVLSLGLLSATGDLEVRDIADAHSAGLKTRVRFALVVAVTLLVGTAGVSLWGAGRSRVAARERQQSALWREHFGGLLSSVQDAETGQRGFLLTKDEAFLVPYRSALVAVPRYLDEIATMAGDDAGRLGRVDSLRNLVTDKMSLIQVTVGQALTGHRDSAIARVRGGRGRSVMDQVRGLVAGISAEQDSLVALWDARLVSHDRLATTSSIVAGLLAVIFLWLAGGAINRDIQKRAEAEQERDRFFALSLDLLCIARDDGYFKRLSPAFTRTLGWSTEEMLRRPFLDFVHPDDRAATLLEVERQSVRGEPVLSFENRYQHQNGSWRILSWRSIPQPGGFMYATARDVTDLRQGEEALRQAKEAAESANRAKSGFLAKMSHELRTPLNSIIGFSEILQEQTVGPLSPKQLRYVGNVLVSGRSLLDLINDILDLSKVEAGRMELTPVGLEVAAVLEEVRGVVAALAERKGLELTVSVEEPVPLLWADRGKFVQIMYNLVGNAIKFTPAGGQVGLIARHHRDGIGPGATEWIEVVVVDSGIGIAAADRERIFGEFEQVGRGVEGEESGTGLGLPLTRKLMELHGGTVTVESTLGRGSTFRCRFPVVATAERPRDATTTVTLSSTPTGPGGAQLVLVVDDEPQARDLLAHYLAEAGYRVATVGSGEEALFAAEALQPDAITLDILMPGRDGLVTLAQLKNSPSSRNIPVVVVSVSNQRELGFSLGAVDWLVKPVQRTMLLAALERTLGSTRHRPPQSILVVDDDEATRDYLHEILQQRGYTVELAAGGVAGVARALAGPPDLVLLDLVMPDMSGFDVVRALRERRETREVPILVLTAKTLSEEERAKLRLTVQGIVPKGGKAELLEELDRIWAQTAGTAR